MRETTLHPTPRLRAVATEQVRAVGIAIRREAVVALIVIAAPTTLALLFAWAQGGSMPFGSVEDLAILGWWTGVAAFFAPLAVWKGEETFGSSPLWVLPVDHRRHGIIKVAAGGVWLLVALAAVFAWFLLLAVATGGSVGVEATRNVLDASAPEGYRAVTAGPPLWQWFAPFTGAVAVYMIGSAVHLGTRHPWRWIAGTAFLAVVLAMLVPESGLGWLEGAWTGATHHMTVGPYGFDSLLAGGVEGLEEIHRLPTEMVGTNVWTELPTIGRWTGATLLWLAVGLVALLAAVSRHRQE